MKRFEIGPGVTCDLDRLVDTRLLVQANSGGGKSWLLRRLLEQTHGQVQHLVIDPEGEFASLRERFDYVLAARSGGDTAADPRSAALLAERLLELKVSAILDIYELKPHERIRFVKLFLEALVNAPKDLWHPVLVVVDEAHVYCPEAGQAESADAVKDLATRGRKRGFCAVLATQRLSKLHKDAAAECNNKLIGRTTLDVDVKRAAHELGVTDREALLILRALHPGEFFAYGPALDGTATEHGVYRTRTGAIVTTHPKAGARLAFTAPPPTSKVRALLPKAEVEERVKSVDALKRELAQARADLTRLKHAQPTPAEPKTVERAVLKDGQLARAERLIEQIGKVVDRAMDVRDSFNGGLTQLETVAVEIETAIASTRAPHAAPVAPLSRQTPPAPRPVAGPPRRVGEGATDASIGRSGLHRMLVALAQRPHGLTRGQLGLRARVSAKGGSFDTYLSKARVNGWVDTSNERIRITDAGLTALGSYERAPEGKALLDHYVREFGASGTARMLQALADVYPGTMTRQELSAATNVSASGGSFDTYLSKLRTLELVEGKTDLRASAELFE